MSETAVYLNDVHKSFGHVRAADGLTLSVPRGSVVGLLGLNGAGKTTMMRLIAGLIRAESGQLRVLGCDPWTMGSDDRRRVGYLSEKDFPFPYLTLEQATSLTSRFFPSLDTAYMQRLVELLQVPTDLPYTALSRGQQRKFQLVLTLAPRPELVLLDDPGQGLDVTVRRQFVESILPLLEEGQSTILFSSHVMSDVERIADSIAVIHAGRVVLYDALDDLKNRARQVAIIGEGSVPSNAIHIRRSRGAVHFTLLSDAEKVAESLRRSGARVEIHPIALEDLFIDVIESQTTESQLV